MIHFSLANFHIEHLFVGVALAYIVIQALRFQITTSRKNNRY